MDEISKEEYGRMAERASPPTRPFSTVLAAFCSGGGICALGQLLLELYRFLGLSEEKAFGAVSVSLIFLSVLATALNVYDRAARFAGAGTLVPITGFANAVAAPAMEFKTEGLILGTGARMFTIAGPVIVYGTAASCLYGVLYALFG